MNKLKIGENLYLEENREYTVISTIQKNNYDYAYLLTTQEPYIVKFAKVTYKDDNLNLEIVKNQKEKAELLDLFQEKLKYFQN